MENELRTIQNHTINIIDDNLFEICCFLDDFSFAKLSLVCKTLFELFKISFWRKRINLKFSSNKIIGTNYENNNIDYEKLYKKLLLEKYGLINNLGTFYLIIDSTNFNLEFKNWPINYIEKFRNSLKILELTKYSHITFGLTFKKTYYNEYFNLIVRKDQFEIVTNLEDLITYTSMEEKYILNDFDTNYKWDIPINKLYKIKIDDIRTIDLILKQKQENFINIIIKINTKHNKKYKIFSRRIFIGFFDPILYFKPYLKVLDSKVKIYNLILQS